MVGFKLDQFELLLISVSSNVPQRLVTFDGHAPFEHSLCHLQFIDQGLFKAELDEFLRRELAEDGYSNVEIRSVPSRTEIKISATRTQSVLGEKGRRIRELTSVVEKRWGLPKDSVSVSGFRHPDRPDR